MATKRIKFEQPFNAKIPPLFIKGGLLYKPRDLGVKIGFMVEMPETHFPVRAWQQLHEAAKRELMDICFLERRAPSYAELSQLDWLDEAGHKLWMKDEDRPRCNLYAYIEKLEKRIAEMGSMTMEQVGKANRK